MRSPVQLVALSLLLVGSSTAWDLTPRVLARQTGPRAFSVDQILSLPAPDNLTASPAGATIAWTFNERGARNIYVLNLSDRTEQRITDLKPGTGAMWPHWQPFTEAK